MKIALKITFSQDFSQTKGPTIYRISKLRLSRKRCKKATFKGDRAEEQIQVICTKEARYFASNSNHSGIQADYISPTLKAKPEFWHLLGIWMVTWNFLQLNIIVTTHDVYPSFRCILDLRGLLARICVYDVFRRNAQVLYQCHFRLKNRSIPEFDKVHCTIFPKFLFYVLCYHTKEKTIYCF